MEAAVRWSPHRQRFLVVDVAELSLTLNEVDTLERKSLVYHRVSQCGKLPTFGAFDWSKTDESVVALGLGSGSASLIRLSDDLGRSESSITFRIKQPRKCNSIAFSTQDWLAVALDKTRSDASLFIYDAARGAASSQEAIRKLYAAELVSSVRFFPSQPQEILASTQRSFIRLHDLRDPQSSGGAGLQVTTRNVNNIAIDPCDENYFASAGSTDVPSVTVWDKRWMAQSPGTPTTGAVFDFKSAVTSNERTTVWSLRYSGQRRGRLAVCSNMGELKVIDMAEGPVSILHTSNYLPTNPHGGHTWSHPRYVSGVRILERPHYDQRYGRGKSRTIAFDWIPQSGTSADQAILALRPDRQVDVLRVSSTRPQAIVTGRSDLALTRDDLSLTEATQSSALLSADGPVVGLHRTTSDDFVYNNGSETVESLDGANESTISCRRDSPAVSRILARGDFQRQRCKGGYLFDCHKNMEMAAGDLRLANLWEFIQRFRDLAADDGMVFNGLDLSFVGVSGIWSETISDSPRRRRWAQCATPDEAIIGLNAARDMPAFDGLRTSFAEHRQLCLLVCGWKFDRDSLERECQELIERGLYYQAIVQAVLHEEINIALNLLRDLIRRKAIQNIGIGALLASDSLNEQQKEMCLWMSADTEDPALKALLTFLTTGDWRDVMRTQYLHLGYRIALGLKYLNDTELSNYIQSQTQRAVMNGNLEGVLLTGLGEQAMDLFQTYLSRTNDLQTAVLATAFTNPLYVDDVRWEMWKETYFMQMQTWRAFVQRSMFTVQHSRLARTKDGQSLLGPPPPAQVTLKCTHCRKSLARHSNSDLFGAAVTAPATPKPSDAVAATISTTAVAAPRPAAHAGTVCPHCGRHMPRCGICKLWLGTPNPSSPGGARELRRLDDLLAKFITFCVSCGHGFHADHAKSWFARHEQCPVPDCRCLCGLLR